MTNQSVEIVHTYLALMEQRKLDAAAACLGPGFHMTFPGAVRFSELDQLVEWASQRYRSIGKKIEHFDVCQASDGSVVYCFGTLFGQWLDGTDFDSIRFIDRFVVRDNLLVEQSVWNDLAEQQRE